MMNGVDCLSLHGSLSKLEFLGTVRLLSHPVDCIRAVVFLVVNREDYQYCSPRKRIVELL